MSWRIIDVTQDGRYLHVDRNLRACPNRPAVEALANRIGKRAPPKGDVSIMFFTDKQYGLTRNYSGRAVKETEKKPAQFTLF